jgi:hypothetical protein
MHVPSVLIKHFLYQYRTGTVVPVIFEGKEINRVDIMKKSNKMLKLFKLVCMSIVANSKYHT